MPTSEQWNKLYREWTAKHSDEIAWLHGRFDDKEQAKRELFSYTIMDALTWLGLDRDTSLEAFIHDLEKDDYLLTKDGWIGLRLILMKTPTVELVSVAQH